MRRKKSERRLASLDESSRAVAGAASLEEALAVVTRCAGEALGVSECVAYELDAELDAIVMRARWERTPERPRPVGGALAAGRGSDGPHRPRNRAAPCSSTSPTPKLDPATRADLESRGEKSRLTVPMPSTDGPVGLLTFGDTERERVFPGEDLAVASALAGLAGEAVRRRQAVASSGPLERGRRDEWPRQPPRTPRVPRPRAGQGRTTTAATSARSCSASTASSPLNDTYGHSAGDEVLRLVAAMLSERTGADDVVGRWAGDHVPDDSGRDDGRSGRPVRRGVARGAGGDALC